MSAKPTIPKGTRDFLPEEMLRRNYLFDTIRRVFETYGYKPIETPAMENLSTLLGKYGDEGDKLLFRILNSGDFLSKVPEEVVRGRDSNRWASGITEKGLRYDLTVPTARYVVQYRNELVFPFKRYQIQPVWRADKPQKGRYREFYQCDVDVIGSNSLMNELELVQIIDEVFRFLGIHVVVKINNRKILYGIAERMGKTGLLTDITVAIDKLDKLGIARVEEELRGKGLEEEDLEFLRPLMGLCGKAEEVFPKLNKALTGSETGMKGLEELGTLFELVAEAGVQTTVEPDISLARGLDYYTGAIIEVKALDVAMGSICGGGRYDDLTGIFGMKDVSGVGISFGADRIYDVMNQLDLFPRRKMKGSQVLFVHFSPGEVKHCIGYAARLRGLGISTEIYPSPVKLKKQFSYADQTEIPWVVMIGAHEVEHGMISVKNMQSGTQETLSFEEFVERITQDDD